MVWRAAGDWRVWALLLAVVVAVTNAGTFLMLGGEQKLQRMYYRASVGQPASPGDSILRVNRLDYFRHASVATSAVVLAGDSQVDLFRNHELLPGRDTVNRGISGERTSQLLERLDNLLEGEDGALIVLVGINDFQAGRPLADVERDFTALAETACGARRRTYLVSVAPVNDALYKREILTRSNAKQPRGADVAALNAHMARLAQGCDRLAYLDLASVIAPTGEMDPRYTSDGLHLNAAGMRAFADLMSARVSELRLELGPLTGDI